MIQELRSLIRPFVTAWDTLSALEVEGGQAQGFKGEMEQETRWDCKRWEVQKGRGREGVGVSYLYV